MTDEHAMEDILDNLAWEGCRLFTWQISNESTAWRANIDRPETGYERWDNEKDHPTEMAAILDVYARFLPHAMGGRDAE